MIKTKITDCIVARITADQMESYIKSGKGLDKAGGLGFEDQDGLFIDQIFGCYPNILGFPLCDVAKILEQMGAKINPNFSAKIKTDYGYDC